MCSCAHRGPATVVQDRFDYATAIADSAKAQALLNVVKLRYSDWPVFLEVQQVVAGYSWEHLGKVGLLANSPLVAGEDVAELGYVGRYVERPTISYVPMGGTEFVKSVLTPARPDMLLFLVESGFPVDRLFGIMLDGINGRPNRPGPGLANDRSDHDFNRILRLLRRLQLTNALSLKFSRGAGGQFTVMLGFRSHLLDPETLGELDAVKRLLGLDPNLDRFEVIYDSLSPDSRIIAMQTRSVLKLMAAIAAFVDVPQEDLDAGRAARLAVNRPVVSEGEVPRTPNDTTEDALFSVRIHSGDTKPEDAFTAVRYADHWFWIENTDVPTKRVFMYLSFLLSVTKSGEGTGPDLVITTN